MKAAQGSVGRVFILRLEDGERMPGALEEFAEAHGVSAGLCILVGGIGGGKIVVGPEDGAGLPVTPLIHALAGVHEIAGVGLLARDGEGKPKLHMHAALGRAGKTVSGCIRPGIEVWHVGEVVVLEILGTASRRVADEKLGFALLEP